jgi:hypothetical protein
LEFASEELPGNKEVVLEAVRQSGCTLHHSSEELCGDKEVVLEAVRQNGYALGLASEELRGDKEVVLEAVRQAGSALSHASVELRGDKEVVLEAVRQYGDSLNFAACQLRADRLMQPASAQSNSIAVQGSVAPVSVLSNLELRETTILYQAVVGLAGAQINGEISSAASLGDLAKELAIIAQSKLIYVLVPGSDTPVSPLLVHSPLRDFLG